MLRPGQDDMSQQLFDELSFYTLSHGHPRFIHQHALDAYTAQTASDQTKTIAIFFALMGLYLHVEKAFTGRQVQKAHMQLATRRSLLPRPELPQDRGVIGVADVVATPPGEARDRAIEDWCLSVWRAYGTSGPLVRSFIKTELEIG
jgi:hypothetical protein